MRWSEAELARHLKGEAVVERGSETAAHKFSARRTEGPRGRIYDSALEAARAGELEIAQRAGIVRRLREQVRFELHDGLGQPYLIGRTAQRRGRRATFVADFVYEERDAQGAWQEVIEDTKGFDTPVARLKRAIVERMLATQVRVTRRKARKKKGKKRV